MEAVSGTDGLTGGDQLRTGPSGEELGSGQPVDGHPADASGGVRTTGAHPGAVLAALADDGRLRALAAVALGAADPAAVAQATGSTPAAAARSVARLVAAGVVVETGAGLEVRPEAFAAAARAAGRLHPRVSAEELGATPRQAAVLRGYLDERGRLTHLPTQHSKRLVVLDFVAGRFEPGVIYPEQDVTLALQPLHRDYAMLRRALVDAGFLERRDGFYWRAGGTTDP